MTNKTQYAFMGFTILMLIALGVTVLPEDTHYSECLNITMHCESLSRTANTCYPHTDDRKGSKYSICGWIPIIFDSVPATKEYQQSNGDWVCNHAGCSPIS